MNAYLFVSLLIISLVTVLTRALPFLAFREGTPPWVSRLGKLLPGAMIAMLVVYCLKGLSFGSLSSFLPELVSLALVAFLQAWKRKTLLSITAGTVLYMLLVQLVFA